MKFSILLTSTSFQDTPGDHQKLLFTQNFRITTLRGPLKENDLLEIIHDFDGIICGDDEITEAVIKNGISGKLKVISKYGSGLDKIDLSTAKKNKLPVESTPGINQISVAEHIFALLLSFMKNIIPEHEIIQNGNWVRLIGNELNGKSLGIIGMGNVGKEVVKRALAFNMNVYVFDICKDHDFEFSEKIIFCNNKEELLSHSDILSLNLPLNNETFDTISYKVSSFLRKGVIIINTARGRLVDNDFIVNSIESGLIGGYLADVLDEEPILSNHPFLGNKKIIITPHISSRTYENVVNQGIMSVKNLLKHFTF